MIALLVDRMPAAAEEQARPARRTERRRRFERPAPLLVVVMPLLLVVAPGLGEWLLLENGCSPSGLPFLARADKEDLSP